MLTYDRSLFFENSDPRPVHFLATWSGGATIGGKPTELDITDEMRSACESILPPLSETMIDLLSRVEPESQDTVRNNIILAGGSSLISGLAGRLQRALSEVGGGRVSLVKDPLFAGSDGGLAVARDAANSDWETLYLRLPLGLLGSADKRYSPCKTGQSSGDPASFHKTIDLPQLGI